MQNLENMLQEIERLMAPVLDNSQMAKLHMVLQRCSMDLEEGSLEEGFGNKQYIEMFLQAKKLEGCSERTLGYYESTLLKYISSKDASVVHETTMGLREYLTSYQDGGCVCGATVDNVRRVLSSFFSWLEEEEFIIKSPMRRIKKIRVDKPIKETFHDEALEMLRDSCSNGRDLAIVDLLASTGMRVGELVKLERHSINFEKRECVVMGKGSKERKVYFDARTKLHLSAYLNSRQDDNSALFVSRNAPHDRLQISGVESMLRKLGNTASLKKVHPHKFRRTLATRAIDKGMPIEQVQVLLGHKKIDTTLQYAMVDQRNVKNSHQRFIA